MESMRLRREVLPPRQAPSEPCDLMTAERQAHHTIAHTIWALIFFTSAGSMTVRLLEALL
jgi:hypothetical protein